MAEDVAKQLSILSKIGRERDRQVAIYGAENALTRPNLDRKLTILTEEVGEVARAVLNGDIANLHEELVQVAAVAVAWLEADS